MKKEQPIAGSGNKAPGELEETEGATGALSAAEAPPVMRHEAEGAGQAVDAPDKNAGRNPKKAQR